jgi:hypothetical protein
MIGASKNAGLTLCLVALLSSFEAQADTITLHDGKSYSGDIENPDQDPVYIKIPNGRIGFYRYEIADIVYNEEQYDLMSHLPDEEEGESGVLPSVKDMAPPATDQERQRRYESLVTALRQVARHPEEADEADLELMPEYIEAFSVLGPKVALQLEETLRGASPLEQPYLLEALDRAEPDRGRSIANEMLSDASPAATREAAVRVLSRSTDQQAGERVAQVLKNDSATTVRAATVEALTNSSLPDAETMLVDALGDPSPVVQRMAKRSLEDRTGESFDTAEAWHAWVDKKSQP